MNKFWLLIIILVVVALGGIYLGGGFKGGVEPTEPITPPDEAAETFVPATGNIDDAVAAILGDLAGEELAPEESDPVLVNTDDQVIEGFDQSFDSSQF